ncbi:MAG: permease [Eubacteriales bacterium]
MAFTIILYAGAIVFLLVSFFKDRGKTKLALKKAWKSFENILPQFIAIIIIVGIVLAVLNAQTISALIGEESGLIGVAILLVIGAITLMPAYVAFPLAASLLHSGGGYMQLAAFISALMMVGIMTMPLEIKYFGKKATLLRNGLAFVFSFFIAIVMGVFLH